MASGPSLLPIVPEKLHRCPGLLYVTGTWSSITDWVFIKNPEIGRRVPDIGVMLGQHHRPWSNAMPFLGQYVSLLLGSYGEPFTTTDKIILIQISHGYLIKHGISWALIKMRSKILCKKCIPLLGYKIYLCSNDTPRCSIICEIPPIFWRWEGSVWFTRLQNIYEIYLLF